MEHVLCFEEEREGEGESDERGDEGEEGEASECWAWEDTVSAVAV